MGMGLANWLTVLRILLVAQDRAAVAIQRLVMALVDRGEGDSIPTRRA